MARGFLSGAFWGVLVAVGGAGTLSVLSDGGTRVPMPETEAVVADLTAQSKTDPSHDDGEASLPMSAPAVTGTPAPPVVTPTQDDAPDDAVAPDSADTVVGAQPDAPSPESDLSQPATRQATAPTVEVESEAPVVAEVQTDAPIAPLVEQEGMNTTEATQPMAPPVETAQSAPAAPEAAPDPVDAPGPRPVVQSAAPAEPAAPLVNDSDAAGQVVIAESTAPPALAEVVSPPTPSAQNQDLAIKLEPAPKRVEKTPVSDPEVTQPTVAPAPEVEAVQVPTAPEPKVTAAPEPESEPSSESETETAAAAAQNPETNVPPAPEPAAEDDETAPAVAQVPQPKTPSAADSATPAIRIGKPASGFKTLGESGVKVSRLPSVRPVTEQVAEAEVDPAADSAVPAEDRSALPPIKRFANEFQDTENKPKMAIVLIDESDGPVAIDALTAFPYPLAVAVDTSRADASDKMALYRAAGFEVLAMMAMPQSATPTDVEVSMPVLLGKVPEAVGVMEAPGGGLQFDRKVSDQVARILADTGHGLLLYSKGLNTAQKLAAKNGVPSATIFRDVDAKGQNARTIRRFLNNGALKAGSVGGVVMVGRLRPDTISALLLWGLEDRASQISLAPVSQLLQPQK